MTEGNIKLGVKSVLERVQSAYEKRAQVRFKIKLLNRNQFFFH